MNDTIRNKIAEAHETKVLNLAHMGLTEIPEAVFEIEGLNELWLYSNEITSLPESIGNLVELEYLSLDGNRLTNLPESIGNLKKLRTSWLVYNNQLIPLSIYRAP